MQAYAKRFGLQERERQVKLVEVKIESIHNAGCGFIKVDKLEGIPRTCLRCEREFTAQGKFNRICDCCKPKTFKQPWEQDD
jgi:hypothetical protein